MPWGHVDPRVNVVAPVSGLRGLRLLSRTGAEACVVIARALVGLWSVPDDDWALPGLSPDCLRLRAWAGQRYWPVSSAQQHQLSLNYPWSASGLARLQYRWQSVL